MNKSAKVVLVRNHIEGIFPDVALKSKPCETSLVYPYASCTRLTVFEMIHIKDLTSCPSVWAAGSLK